MVVGTLNLENLAKSFIMEAFKFVIYAEEQIWDSEPWRRMDWTIWV